MIRSVVCVPNDSWSRSNAIELVAKKNRSAEAVLTSIDLVAHKANWLARNALSSTEEETHGIERAFLKTRELLAKLSIGKVSGSDYRNAVKYQAESAALVGAIQITIALLRPLAIQAKAMTLGNLGANSDLRIDFSDDEKDQLPFPVKAILSALDVSRILLEKHADVYTSLKAIDDATRACREYEKVAEFNRTQVSIAAASVALSIAALFERETAIALWNYFGLQTVNESYVFITELLASLSGAVLVYVIAYFWSKQKFD